MRPSILLPAVFVLLCAPAHASWVDFGRDPLPVHVGPESQFPEVFVEMIRRLCAQIPDVRQHMTICDGWYSHRARGERQQAPRRHQLREHVLPKQPPNYRHVPPLHALEVQRLRAQSPSRWRRRRRVRSTIRW